MTDTGEILRTLDKHGIRRVKVGGFDVDGVLRGKYISADKLKSSLEKGLGFCDVIFGWDSSDQLYDNVQFTGWHTGYPDALAKIVPGSMRIVPWEDSTAFFLLDFFDGDGGPLPISPRQVLKRVVKRAEDMGYTPLMSSEYEYFIFRETSDDAHRKGFVDLRPLSEGMFGYSVLRASMNAELVHAVIDGMQGFGIPLEGFHTETGPGVYETAIAYDHALESASRAALFKAGMKEIAARRGLLATFMAKITPELPGCSGHVHQSLWDKDRSQNLFHHRDGKDGMSSLFRSYLAGVLTTLPELTAIYAPTINSYKRFVEGTWAPTRANWGLENRTTAARVIRGPGDKATRLELRVVGADTNAFLVFAAALAAGLHGVERKLEPPEVCKGNGYEDPDGRWASLPRSLEEATDLLDRSEFAREWLGSEFVDHFVATRRWEVRQFRKVVTSWERTRYMEII